MSKIVIEANGRTFEATLRDCAATRALLKRLPATYEMSELNGNEKYVYLNESLPVQETAPKTIQEGDLMLFGSNCLVIFYKSFSTSYRYTVLGRIDQPSGLAKALGTGSARLSFRLAQ